MALRIIKERGGSVPFDIINSLIVVGELSSWLYKRPWRCRGLMVSVRLLESCYRNQDKLQPDEPLELYVDLTLYQPCYLRNTAAEATPLKLK